MSKRTKTRNIVELINVTKAFQVGGTDLVVLHGIDLAVKEGEFLSIVGPSGNGKTTMLNMIAGIDRPTSGEVNVTGFPIHSMTENQLARWRGENVGIIFQFFQMLPSLSLLQNVALPMELSGKYKSSERRERAYSLLESVGLADQVHKLPSMVSGGQQQRAAIARALANDPALLIADEPTGNLDAKTAESVLELFNELVARGKTLLMVTHDKELAQSARRTVEIRNGLIVRDTSRLVEPILESEPIVRSVNLALQPLPAFGG